jgi:uncharacterized membrane protein YciS (DUF1049 family)
MFLIGLLAILLIWLIILGAVVFGLFWLFRTLIRAALESNRKRRAARSAAVVGPQAGKLLRIQKMVKYYDDEYTKWHLGVILNDKPRDGSDR